MTPATKGADWEVPDLYSVAKSEAALADWIFVPGAQILTHGPKLEAVPGEIHSLWSLTLVAATVNARGSLRHSVSALRTAECMLFAWIRGWTLQPK